jgi:SAM-dependent methyltransferase
VSTTYINATADQGLRARCKSTWEAGDFAIVAKFYEATAAEFMARLSLRPGQRVLDVACGTGNLAFLAGKAGCSTHGLDIASHLIAKARHRAEVEKVSINFTEGDAEELPYPDAEFDLVVSMWGVIFAPRPERAAAELLRVCRPGGTIALANWTPQGLLGENLRIISRHISSPSCAISPLTWGDEATIQSRLAHGLKDLRLTRRIARLRYPFSPAQTVDFFRQFYGPTVRAFASLNCQGQLALHADLEEMFMRHNRSTDPAATEVEAEYLEVIATRS